MQDDLTCIFNEHADSVKLSVTLLFPLLLELISLFVRPIWQHWQTLWDWVKGVGPHMGADGVLQRSVPFVDNGVVFRLDQQLRALPSLQLQPGERDTEFANHQLMFSRVFWELNWKKYVWNYTWMISVSIRHFSVLCFIRQKSINEDSKRERDQGSSSFPPLKRFSCWTCPWRPIPPSRPSDPRWTPVWTDCLQTGQREETNQRRAR